MHRGLYPSGKEKASVIPAAAAGNLAGTSNAVKIIEHFHAQGNVGL